MKKYILVPLACIFCLAARADEATDVTAPKRISDIMKSADRVVLDFGDYDHPQKVEITDHDFIKSVSQVFAEATYLPRLHSFSISPSIFAFYKGKELRTAVSFQPESVIRLSNAKGEENFEVGRKTIDALFELYRSKKGLTRR